MALRGPRREALGENIRISVFERCVTIGYRIKGEHVTVLRLFYAGEDTSAGIGREE